MRAVSEQDSEAEPPRLRVHHREVDGAVVVAVSGEVDLATVPELEEQLFAALGTRTMPVVADLTEVSFLDSIGLSMLVRCHQLGLRNGTALRVVAATRAVVRPLEVTMLDGLLDLYPTVTAALATTAPDRQR